MRASPRLLFPFWLSLTVTSGDVSGLGRAIPINGIKRRELVQSDAPVNPGNGGGPLLADNGQVVGLVDLGSGHANGMPSRSLHKSHTTDQASATARQPIPASCSTPSQSLQAATPPSQPTANASFDDLLRHRAFDRLPGQLATPDAAQPESYGSDTTIVFPTTRTR